jgi:phage-related minor tail protein
MTDSQKEAVDAMVEEVRKHAEATEMLRKNYDMVKGAVDKAFTVMENSILGLIDGTKHLKDVMKDMLRSFIADLAVAILKMLIFDRIKNAILGGVSSAMSVPTDTPVANFNIHQNASGGAIGSNQPTLVGERGPEIFMPRTAGRIINANDSRSMMGGGQGVTVVQNNNFAVGVTPTVRAEVLNMMPLIKAQTLNAVADAKQRGGGFRSALSDH